MFGLLKRIFDPEGYQKQKKLERIELRKKQFALLGSGPVVVSTYAKYHRARYQNDSEKRSPSPRIFSACPNAKPEYRPQGRSGHHRVAQVAAGRVKPCAFCFHEEYAQGLFDGEEWIAAIAEFDEPKRKVAAEEADIPF